MRLYLLTVLLFMSFTSCKTAETSSQTTIEAPQENAVSQDAQDEKPEEEIVLVVNGIVKYNFVKTDGTWEGTITQFDSADPDRQEVVRVLEVEPTMGWDDFEQFLDSIKLYNIPDQSDIENRISSGISNISRAYQFYIFDGENSRSFSYYNPEGELHEHWQSRNVVTFGTYLISEMEVVSE